jgi:PIN domain nuclease of toxin-antitoxin system
MRYLLDTHALIWHFENSPRLPQRTKDIINNSAGRICLCSVSLWEIAIKVGAGKLKFRFTFEELLDKVKNGDYNVLPIKDEYLKQYILLPSIHKDPFDRLLISTALVENLTLITADENIRKYDVPWVW